MRAKKGDNMTFSVDHTKEREDKRSKRRFYFNTKSCMAMAVSAALLFTSVDSMTVRAEELADMVLPVIEEESPEAPEKEGISNEISYLKNDEGAVIISSFKALREEDSHIELEQKRTLEEVRELMPKTLTANVTLGVSTSEANGEPGEGEQPDEGETDSGEEEQQPGADDNGDQSGADSDSGDNGNTNDDNGDQDGPDNDNVDIDTGNGDQGGADSDSGDNDSINEDGGELDNGNVDTDIDNGDQSGADSDNGENDSENDDSGNGDNDSADSDSSDGSYENEEDNNSSDSSGADSQSNVGDINDMADAVMLGIPVQDGQCWRLLVETGESETELAEVETDDVNNDAGNSGEGDGSEKDSNSGTESGGDGTDGIEDGSEGGGTGGTESGGENDGDVAGEDGADMSTAEEEEKPDTVVLPEDDVSITTVEEEVPVTWECESYDTEEADVYIFVPRWDEKEWFFEESERYKIPTIEVAYTVLTSEVSTEEELTAAFVAGFKRIVLQNDIALTKPLTLPADADIELEGGGYKLIRGNAAVEGDGSSEVFLDVMIDMDGEDYTEDTYGALTLKNITVDGATESDRAGAPVIIDRGSLTLGVGARVIGNYNYGTLGDEEAEARRIPEYGGGICVYRELVLEDQPQPSVMGNYADLLGGGVYLGEEAELWLYGDVIQKNTVADQNGSGPDLYAAPYSKIHYDITVFPDIESWPTFFLSKGVVLLPIGKEREIAEPAKASNREIYISVSKNSGYSAKELSELTDKLNELGYTVISSKRTEIDTTDLRNWAVYDHYDKTCWPGGSGDTPSETWGGVYAEYKKRPYYPCTENYVHTSEPSPRATTIQEWLAYLEKGEYKDSNGKPELAHFQEHIYSREENEKSAMTFVGYGSKPYIDFLYYNPQSNGEKVVSFDVDSSKLYTHTLAGNGFLINAGEKNGELIGYLVYYTYLSGGNANKIYLYRLNQGLTINDFHAGTHGSSSHDIGRYAVKIAEETITDWKPQMSIKIKVTPKKVQVWQQEQQPGVEIDETTKAFVSWDLENTSYSGYGPLVAYQSHNCREASSFTYSNLYMYFTDMEEAKKNIMRPLEEADFTQEDTQKYFVNLFGADDLEYGENNFSYYQDFLKLMQEEGIALITDRNAPFEDYLGSANAPKGDQDPGNLLELTGGGPKKKLTIDDLVNQIDAYLKQRETTSLKEMVEGGVLKEATPNESVGNFWLKAVADGKQIRRPLREEDIGESGYEIQMIDDITYYYGNKEDHTVIYKIQKPEETGFNTTLSNPFRITRDRSDWPAGSYVVQQTIMKESGECAVQGYAYFDLELPPPPVDPVTFPVTVNVAVNKDGQEWNEHGRAFKLQPKDGGALIDLPGAVSAGTYDVYDVTGLDAGTSPAEDRKRDSITVEAAYQSGIEKEVTIDYYTVTFYDGETAYPENSPLAPKIVLRGEVIARPEPEDEPSNPPYKFAGWMTDQQGNNVYDFNTPINGTTNIYARWTYPVVVTVTVNKDGSVWNDHGRKFVLQPEDGEALKEPFLAVPAGKYTLYDVTGLADDAPLTEDRNTGCLLEVENSDTPNNIEEIALDYYTVTFYDENTADKKPCESGAEQNPQIVLKDQCAGRPEFIPEKDKHAFVSWVTADGTEFDFDSRINKPTEVYAKWEQIKEPRYKVTIDARKDGGEWKDAGRIFALRAENEDGETVFDLEQVKAGVYRIYDLTGSSSASYRSRAMDRAVDVRVEDGDTGVTVTVENKDEAAAVDYYTVTFYDGKNAYGIDTPQSQFIVLSGKKVTEPSEPGKKGYQFTGWKTEDGGSIAFDFDQAIRNKTDIYAGWKANKKETGGGNKEPGGKHTPDDNGGGGTRDTQTIAVRQDASLQTGISDAGVSQTGSNPESAKTPFGAGEPKTEDATQIEIYATVAMIAGLTYLLLYFMEERKGMSEREKDVFVAAFIRWAKKGGTFRRCCAIVFIFGLLVYYHSIGKHAGKGIHRGRCSEQAL